MPLLLAMLLALAALAAPSVAESEPLTVEAYATQVVSWHQDWRTAGPTAAIQHERCIQNWQHIDAIRERMLAVEPPAARAEYHAALISFVEAYLKLLDICVGNPSKSPEWRSQTTVVRERRSAIVKLVGTGRLGLPTW